MLSLLLKVKQQVVFCVENSAGQGPMQNQLILSFMLNHMQLCNVLEKIF